MNEFKSMDAAIIVVTPDGITTSSSTATASIFDNAAFIIIG